MSFVHTLKISNVPQDLFCRGSGARSSLYRPGSGSWTVRSGPAAEPVGSPRAASMGSLMVDLELSWWSGDGSQVGAGVVAGQVLGVDAAETAASGVVDPALADAGGEVGVGVSLGDLRLREPGQDP